LLDNAQLNSFITTNIPELARSVPQASSEAAPPEATQVIGPQAAPVPPPGPPPVAGPMPYAALIERTQQGPGHVYQINREVIHIGRHTSNDIVINDRRVSRYHAEIRYERGQFVIYDLGSLNGVSINNSMTRQATLRNGDVLAFGSFSFVFERR
ncbi:MAG TPA: FHA domain-containing protein, partial [Ktedonobacterales bacterium]|nr:FHA domain-containing protein [Ktedonobacterales bacterium]